MRLRPDREHYGLFPVPPGAELILAGPLKFSALRRVEATY
jgi:hypothetical protein